MNGEKYPYQKEWEKYRRLRNADFGIFFIGGLGIMILAGIVGLFWGKQGWFEILLFIIWFFFCLRALIKFHNWQCPRCGERFFTYSFFATSPIFISNCRNCNLPKYSGSTFLKYF
ncbi:MAG TPA: hypothetical protein PKY59_27075 [Pyrinomonadaceae bacterium]|nr:hypothetical protein [Pyrinomonadaceae bacterium]